MENVKGFVGLVIFIAAVIVAFKLVSWATSLLLPIAIVAVIGVVVVGIVKSRSGGNDDTPDSGDKG